MKITSCKYVGITKTDKNKVWEVTTEESGWLWKRAYVQNIIETADGTYFWEETGMRLDRPHEVTKFEDAKRALKFKEDFLITPAK